jgi:hypothetical protein
MQQDYFRRRKISKLAKPRPINEAEAGSGITATMSPAAQVEKLGLSDDTIELAEAGPGFMVNTGVLAV